MVHCIYSGVADYNFPKKFLIFVFANSVEPDEMPHYVAFHLGLHCLPKYSFRSLCFDEKNYGIAKKKTSTGSV